MKKIRICLAQINTTVGDIEGNTDKVISCVKRAKDEGADIVAFPELCVTGYPPEDLLLKPQFIEDNLGAIKRIRDEVEDIVAVVGFVDRDMDIHNAAAVIHKRHIIDRYHKMFLPNYGVFDELRYFRPGNSPSVYKLGDILFGINICEDIWYPDGPSRQQAMGGAQFIININASPYHMGKPAYREKMLSTRASDNSTIIAYLNAVGGQDELVFDGQSFVVDQRGELIARGKQFEEDFMIVDLDLEGVFMSRLHNPRMRQNGWGEPEELKSVVIHGHHFKEQKLQLPKKGASLPLLSLEEEVYKALSLGVKDYVEKNGFQKVLIGLSGGIDSSLVATIAVDALGSERVKGLFMPSPYTSRESKEDVEELVDNLGIECYTVSIEGIFSDFLNALSDIFKGTEPGVAEENIQARIRGNLLMAVSNKFGYLVLTTGNKSEMSVGYATLYGDMAGGFAVIKDVPKTLVYKLAEWRNDKEDRPLIPERVLIKPPSAELRPDQKDTDTLPPYEVLDRVLKAYVEEDRSYEEILALDCEEDCVKKVIRMIDRSEYKRRQSPPGIKITPRAFGRERRFPITNRYRSY